MKKKKGFTLIELMVVIAIIAALSAIVLGFLGNSRAKGNDSKVQALLKSMVSQAQLFVGTNTNVSSGTAVAVPITNAAGLFNDSSASSLSLYRLINGMPTGSLVFYASENKAPISGGKWAIAASTSDGSSCIDYTGVEITQKVTQMTTAGSCIASAGAGPCLYPNLTLTYTCN